MNMHTLFFRGGQLHPFLDLAPVMAALVTRMHWDASRVAEAEQIYRMFLELHRHYPGDRFALPTDADAVWHAHILMTARYRADCAAVLGRFLDHDPIAEISADHRAQSEKRFRDEFAIEVACDAASM